MPPTIDIAHITNEPQIHGPEWDEAVTVEISTYWSGEVAPSRRAFEARLLWSDEDLLVRFDYGRHEPLVISDEPKVDSKTLGLWERDVCEIFIAPDANDPGRYFEFEVAPTGEWLDLELDLRSGERVTNWDYRSYMETSARVDSEKVTMAMHIPWSAFRRKPEPGDVWLGNLFRCVGSGPDRGYLAWSPTLTERPNFHVPVRFGGFRFVA